MIKKLVLSLGIVICCLQIIQAQKNKPHDFSQENYVITNLDPDTVPERERASATLRALKSGAVVVRLKTNDKSVAAYRKAGRDDVADRITAERRKQNEKMYYAYKTYFTFCPVYFIYAHDTKELQNGNHSIFLNSNLSYDTSIHFNYTNYIFSEYGSAEAFSDFPRPQHYRPYDDRKHDKILDTIPVESNTMPASTSALVFLDKQLNQLQRPFPFITGVYLDAYNASVKTQNRELEKAYYRLVTAKDYKDERKREKQKGKK
ncbi:MAG: hypothetical protein U0V74_05365 [Chitinophagales bacterium]